MILGLTFKENVPDLRNSKIMDVIKELEGYGVEVVTSDPVAYSHEAMEEYGLKLEAFKQIQNTDAVIIAVNHDAYKKLSLDEIDALYKRRVLKSSCRY